MVAQQKHKSASIVLQGGNMKQSIFTIVSNAALTDSVYKMVLQGDTSAITAPGQFVNIKLEGMFLRRPISVCDVEGDKLTIIYKVVGKGTEAMSRMSAGELDILTGLGNGYDLTVSGEKPVLLGGGVGVPPMYKLAKELIAQGKKVSVILGFNTKNEIFYEEAFKNLGAEVFVTTVDGSYGIRGFVTDALKDMDYTYFYTCGPEPMLKAVYRASVTSGQMSFEERMGCGFGACMGCSCKTLTGYKRICKEGPVMRKEEILWEN
jgi:dihydroorotate dehydrogenase electron transfer subunit